MVNYVKSEYINKDLVSLLESASNRDIDEYFLDEIYEEAKIEGYNYHNRDHYKDLLEHLSGEVVESFSKGWKAGMKFYDDSQEAIANDHAIAQ